MNLSEIIEQDLKNATDLDCAIAVGMDAADDEERGRWRIAALADTISHAYGTEGVTSFAKGINRKKTYVYEAGQTLGFYGLGNILELTNDRVITYSHMRDAMRAYRKLHAEDIDTARDEALQWLDVVAGDLMTVEQAARKLKERLGILPTPAIRFSGTVRSVGGQYVLFVIPDGKKRMDAWFAEGQKVTVSVRVSTCVDEEGQ